MWRRLFGRSKESFEQPTCTECGRTLLAGEMTQHITDAHGNEGLVCSLCGTDEAPATEPARTISTGSTSSAVRQKESRGDSDAFWRALKDKDTEIERLHAHIARGEAERQELAARLAQLQRQLEGAGVSVPLAAAGLPIEPTLPAPETAAEPPAVSKTLPFEPVGAAATGAADAAAAEAHRAPERVHEIPPIVAAAGASAQPPAIDESAAAAAAEADALSLTLLQRGVDLLNVSSAPRKIADTNVSLGLPTVHVGFEGTELAVTFLWSMGWYCFHVSLDSGGGVRMTERGYDQRVDLQPNATVRGDGTVQLAAARIKRPAANQRDALPQGLPLATKGDVIAKSLLGQRTDDEPLTSWDSAKPNDFDWGR